MACKKMMEKGEWEMLPQPVLDSLSPKEDGSGLVRILVPGTLKEATTQEALQRGSVNCIVVVDEFVNGADLVDIVKHYKNVSSLRTVYLRNCNLGVCGGKHMARAEPEVETLYLEGNLIKDGGVKTIATALASNDNLNVLGLCNEGFGCHGAQALATALQANTRLTLLDIRGNDITPEGCKELAYALLRNPGTRLQYLFMDQQYGGIVKGEWQGLLRAFKFRHSLEEQTL